MLLSNDVITDIVALAEAAGNSILEFGKVAKSCENKADNSPVTEADLKASAVIEAGLAQITPNIQIISEETWVKNTLLSDTFWLIDPLDGTRGYVQGSDEFTVNIALIKNKVPIFGVVHAPRLQLTWWAAPHIGAFMGQFVNGSATLGQPIITSKHSAVQPIIIGSRHHPSKVWGIVANIFPQAQILPISSSLKFCRLAQGDAHFYPRFSPTMEWDTAAGHCILNCAGGSMWKWNGDAFLYGKPTLTNPGFMAWSEKNDDWQQYFSDCPELNSYKH